MIIHCISRNQDLIKKVKSLFLNKGYSPVFYTNPLKAIDNIEELQPEIVLFDQRDFPRHWKMMLQSLKFYLQRSYFYFILLTDQKTFSEKEQNEALFLQVDLLLFDELNLKKLEENINAEKSSPLMRIEKELKSLPRNPIHCMFMNRENFQLLSSSIVEIGPKHLRLKPFEPLDKLKEGDTLKDMSININETFFTLDGKIISNQSTLFLSLTFFNKENEELWIKSVKNF